jgi:cell division protein FtsL
MKKAADTNRRNTVKRSGKNVAASSVRRNSYSGRTSDYGRNTGYQPDYRSMVYSGSTRYSGMERGTNERYSYSRSIRGYGNISSPRYNTGSVALDNAYEEERQPVTQTKILSNSKKKIVPHSVREAAPLSLLKTIFTVLVCTGFVLGIVIFIASNTELKSQLTEARQTLTQLNEDNAELKNNIEEKIDLAKVQKEAEKLGMQKPSSYQTVKINVPKESYTVQYGTAEVDEKNITFSEVASNVMEDIQKLFDKILRVE